MWIKLFEGECPACMANAAWAPSAFASSVSAAALEGGATFTMALPPDVLIRVLSTVVRLNDLSK